jgi:hypothetical protein
MKKQRLLHSDYEIWICESNPIRLRRAERWDSICCGMLLGVV